MIMASGRFAHWFAAVPEPSKPLPVPEEPDEAEQDPVVDDEGGNEDESDGGHVPGDDVTPAVNGGSEVAEPSDPAQEENSGLRNLKMHQILIRLQTLRQAMRILNWKLSREKTLRRIFRRNFPV